jgi:hypothetical protein
MLIALLVGTGRSGDTQKDPPKKFPLLPGWGKIGLSTEQRQKFSEIRQTFFARIEAAKAQLDKLKNEEKEALLKILTDGQREQLRKAALEKVGGTTKKTDKSFTDKKSSTDKK